MVKNRENDPGFVLAEGVCKMNKDFLNRSVILKILGLLAFAIGLHWLLQRYDLFAGFLTGVMHLLAPLLMGAAIAFILNLPMRLIEHLIFRKPYAHSEPVFLDRYEKGDIDAVDQIAEKQKKKPLLKPFKRAINRDFFIHVWNVLSRPVSLVLAIVLVLGLTVAVMVIVIPELINSVQALAKKIPEFIASTQKWIQDQFAAFPELERFSSSFAFNWQQIEEAVVKWLEFDAGSIFDSTFKFATAVFGGVFNGILAIIFAIYILIQKETLSGQARQLLKAFVPDRLAAGIERVATLTNQSFNNFIVGQLIEAVILGLLFLATMSIFGFPYVVLISVLIAFTALIPMIGSFIGGTISAVLVLIASPNQVLWFLLLFIVLQQIENNLIYPRVVGSSIGLPGIWVLLAVMIGGRLFGVIGILLFIPVFSIIYVLMRECTVKRIKHKDETYRNKKPDLS